MTTEPDAQNTPGFFKRYPWISQVAKGAAALVVLLVGNYLTTIQANHDTMLEVQMRIKALEMQTMENRCGIGANRAILLGDGSNDGIKTRVKVTETRLDALEN